MPALKTFPDYITAEDIRLFRAGTHASLQEKLGSHRMAREGLEGVHFAVWAPSAEKVSVIGDFNRWDMESHLLQARQDGSGIWEGFIEGLKAGSLYKYHIWSKYRCFRTDKADPYAFYGECPPKTSSMVYEPEYDWKDTKWLKKRKATDHTREPMSVYEVHLGSFKRNGHGPSGSLTYREMADQLVPYVKEMGYSHVEFMPLMEHPFYGSWGYQALGYFSPTARYGTPEDLMFLIDRCHQNGIGVLMDWVAAHFPNDNHGLVYFDGTPLYEQGALHPDWKSCVFNFPLNEVRSFLISSALYWVEKFHIDGLRVDAVASMLYLDYSRKPGEWQPNIYGGRENLEGMNFLRSLNGIVKDRHPDVQMIAEESSSWGGVSRPADQGGLHFDMKWNMGWMHDILRYIGREPLYRGHHDQEIAFCLYYAFSENFMLSFSHDEVVYGKGSMLTKMPGNDREKFANMRALTGFMYGHPGKKLLFMGGEFGQWAEWGHESQLQWELLQYAPHHQLQTWVKDLNRLYATEPALYERDFESSGFEWRDMGQSHRAIFSFARKSSQSEDTVLVVCNFGNIARADYWVGGLSDGAWKEILSSDDVKYGGASKGSKELTTGDGMVTLTVPPLSTVFLKHVPTET